VNVDKNKLNGFLTEMSASKTRAEAERDFQREAIKRIADETQIDKKVLRQLAATYHKQNFVELAQQNEEVASLYTTIVGTAA